MTKTIFASHRKKYSASRFLIQEPDGPKPIQTNLKAPEPTSNR